MKRYVTGKLSSGELSNNHRTSFRNYAEKWVDSYESKIQELRGIEDETEGNQFILDDVDYGFTDYNLYFAIYHLSKIHNELNIDTFIEELEGVDANNPGVFAFGIIAQRFFFEQPKEVISELSKSFLGIKEEVENEIFSGTFDILMNFNLTGYVHELARGWSGEITTNELSPSNMSDPDEVVRTLQQEIHSELYQSLPPQVKTAIARISVLAYTDSRKAREYYAQFGKTAENYGLEEDPFCEYLEELGELLDLLNPIVDATDEEGKDMVETNFESLERGIRDRIELQDYLEQNRSEAQREFQQRLEKIRNRPNEIVEQYLNCGERLSGTANSLFPYLWYAIGHKQFTSIVLGQKSAEVYGEYKYWYAKREDQEDNADESKLVISLEEIESSFD